MDESPRQYPPGTVRDPDTMPVEITDPDGDVWVWTDSDPRGVPGYQVRLGCSCPAAAAYTREYVEQARYCNAHPRHASCHHRGIAEDDR